jgi:TPR repeat protein
MSLEHVVPDASVERYDFHLLPIWRLEELSNKREAEALLILGTRFRLGIGMTINDRVGWKHVIESAELGHPVALALCHERGRSTKRDSALAVSLYEASALRGHSLGNAATHRDNSHAFLAQAYLGICYERAIGVEYDHEAALRCFQASSSQNNPIGHYYLALCYEYGDGVERNIAEAVRLLHLACDQHYSLACTNLALILTYQREWRNFKLAFSLFTLASTLGNSDAMFSLAVFYENGFYVKKNIYSAAYLYRIAAKLGVRIALENFTTWSEARFKPSLAYCSLK